MSKSLDKNSFMSFVEFLSMRAKNQANNIAYTFLVDGESNEVNITYSELYNDVCRIATYLVNNYKKNSRVLLLFPHNLDFIKALYGCFLGGMIAVPTYIPKNRRSADRLLTIVNDCNVSLIISSINIHENPIYADQHYKECDFINIESLFVYDNVTAFPEIKPDDIAFLQYTSGSTSDPKGVIVTHNNLLKNQHLISEAFGTNSNSIVLGWLPFYHDMGLVGNLLQPMFVGCRCILMSPYHFIEKPERWLKAISKYKATVSGGPNFAYDLCIDSINKFDNLILDLSSWSTAFNGAEPVKASTLKNFAAFYSKFGFKLESFQPCYGMAETTLLISANDLGALPEFKKVSKEVVQYTKANINHEIELVGCGAPKGYEVKIVGEKGYVCKDLEVGEIWLKGESVSQGYWNRSTLTKDTFNGTINKKYSGFLKTGDLGFISNNNLFITGRLKEMIILNGKNYYPIDIEHTVLNSHPHIINNGCAVFSVNKTDEESIVIVTEVMYGKEVNYEAIIKSIRKQIFEEYELEPSDIVLIRKGTLPKTTSGKIQRIKCKELFLSNSLVKIDQDNLYKTTSTNENPIEAKDIQEKIYSLLCDFLKVKHIDKNENFFRYGVNSIKITQLSILLSEELNMDVSIEDIFEHPNVIELAKIIYQKDCSTKYIAEEDNNSNRCVKLTSLQRSIWFNEQAKTENSSYNIPLLIKVEKGFDSNFYCKAINCIVKKYEILRSIFIIKDDNPVMEVIDNYNYKIEEINFTLFNEDLKKDKLNEFVKIEVKKRIDLNKLPLFKVFVIKINDIDNFLLVIFHHIIVDGESIYILINELNALYEKIRSEENFDVKTSEYQYRHFVNEQESILKTDSDYLNQKKYWLSELTDEISDIDLPIKTGLSAEKIRTGASRIKIIGKELSDQIKRVAKNYQTTTYNVLLSAFDILLHRLSGNKDILVGSPVTLRNKKEHFRSIGMFINTIIHRINIEPHEEYEMLLGRISEKTRKSLLNRFYPIYNLVKDLNYKIDADKLPFTQIYFNGLSFLDDRFDESFENLYLSNLDLDLNFLMNWYVFEKESGIQIRFDYRKSLLTADQATDIIFIYEEILKQIVFDPKAKIFKLLSAINVKKDILKPNNNYIVFKEEDSHQTVIRRFEEQVDLHPFKIAIKSGNSHFCYSFLNEAANNIAHSLIDVIRKKKCDVQNLSSNPIGLFFGHNINMMFSIIGVLKSGNIYVPLDRDYPKERLKYIINDSVIEIILTDNQNLPFVNELTKSLKYDILVINIEAIGNEINNTNLNIEITPNHLAYILYTSGSTGNPKGVVQDHNYIMHIAYCLTNSLRISNSDRFTLIPSFNFSASMMDMFGALLNGSFLYLIDVKNVGVSSLPDILIRDNITIYHSVPTVFRHFINSITKGIKFKELRLIYLAGEPLLLSDFEYYKEYFEDNCLLVNGLGCTEYNICRQFFMDKNSTIETSVIPVGYKALGADIDIINEEGDAINGNQLGEIVVKSNFLALGYLNNPELTFTKIVKNEEGERQYYTGDIGRILIDGSLIHLGRNDFQVKLRGQRIELGEIELTLNKIEGITSSVVVLKDDGNDKHLCAYFISDKPVFILHLKNKLMESLPTHMIPSYFVELKSFPLTDSGKIDRRNLPEPEFNLRIENLKEDTSDLERELIGTWSEILKISPDLISKKSNFFELGGHSLNVLLLRTKVYEKYEVSLNVRELFHNLTIDTLAHLINVHSIQRIGITKALSKEYYRATIQQEKMYVLNTFAGKSYSYNITSPIILEGNFESQFLIKVIEEIICRHDVFRTSFELVENNLVQILNNPRANIEILSLPEDKIDETIIQFRKQYDVSSKELYRIALGEISENKWLILFDIHHILVDGYSMYFILKEFSQLLERKVLSRPRFQYIDYSEWLQKEQKLNEINSQKNYWLNIFSKKIVDLDFPLDYSRPKVQSFEGSAYEFYLDDVLLFRINSIIRNEQKTFFSFLLTVYNILLSKYTGKQDIIIGAPVAARTSDTEEIIGLFMNALPFRNYPIGDKSFIEFFQEVYNNCVQGFENQEFQFGELLDCIGENRRFDRNPLFDFELLVQNMDFSVLNSDGFKITYYESNIQYSQVDLSLIVELFDKQQPKFKVLYCNDLFRKETIVNLVKSLIAICEIVTTNPEILLKDIIIQTSFKSLTERKLNKKNIIFDL